MRKFTLFATGIALILAGCIFAAAIQTSGGIRVRDVRFIGTNGAPMSALLYVPPNAAAQAPAPGILAIHGYMNSRETQDGFAIEFARRGYVVLALDQTGHGLSSPPAFANGFGGPDGLRYLRSLDIVDTNNIGLEGHSMGGWAVLAAAASMPDGYRSIVLEGSSTGRPFAPEGAPSFPHSMALVFSRYDEFSAIMWGAPNSADVFASPKLMAVFGVHEPVEVGRIYGDISAGTARALFTPPITHAQDHFSVEAIGYSLDWFQRTLIGGTPRPVSDQIWYWKEIGTLIALIGFVVLLLGTFDLLLRLPYFARLATRAAPSRGRRNGAYWLSLALFAALPALLYLPVCMLAEKWLPASPLLPQSFTNQVAVWAVLNGLIAFALSLFKRYKSTLKEHFAASALIALLTIGAGNVALALADALFKVDFRFWVVGLKTLNRERLLDALIYLAPFTLYFVLALRVLHRTLAVKGDGAWAAYLSNIAALAGGFAIFLAIQYGWLFATGRLLTPEQALLVIIGIQFVPLLAIAAIIATFTYRRTNSALPGAFIAALFVTWYIAAGQAVQAAG